MLSSDQDPMWLKMARQLPYGQRKKIICCGSDPSMIISHSYKGYSGHCFRSSDHGGFKPHGQLSLDELKQRAAGGQELMAGPIQLPQDFTLEIPPNKMLWLLKAGVGYELARKYGIGYSARSNRVILPVYQDNELIAFTARAVDGEKPKYIARHKHGYNSAIFSSDPSTILPHRYGSLGVVVIVEDYLSCVRVGRITPTVAFLGTSNKADALLPKLGSDTKAVIWMDPDKAGRNGRNNLARSLSLFGIEPILLNSKRDPKFYSNREIRELIYDRLRTTTVDEVPQGVQSTVRSTAERKQDS